MTVRELIKKLMDCEMDAKVMVYVAGTKEKLKDCYESAECDNDYVLDNFCEVNDIEEKQYDSQYEVWLSIDDFD